MKETDVPQHQSKSFAGERKGVYALDADGNYQLTPSSGWDVEEAVLQQALDQFEQLAAEAMGRYRRGESSKLEHLMYRARMDVAILAQGTGFFRWQIRRHFKPRVYSRLPDKVLARYAQVWGLSLADLKSFGGAE